MKTHLSAQQIRDALELRDLTDPRQGIHCMQQLVDSVARALAETWKVEVSIIRHHPVVSLEANYDRLLIPEEAASREARYTRYLNAATILRTHTSAMVPDALQSVGSVEALLVCPGLVYRRESIGRLHVGEPHQLDLWRIRCEGTPLERSDMEDMVQLTMRTLLPRNTWRTIPSEHSYTEGGMQIDVLRGTEWVEVGECGVANPKVLHLNGLSDQASGLAMGLGLDRILMLRKDIDDIRLLRSDDPRVANQLLDLETYLTISSMPPVRRDISVAVGIHMTQEEIGDRVRDALGAGAGSIEEIEVLSETRYEELLEGARARLGIHPHQKNLLIRVVIRHLERTLTDEEANEIRDRIYEAVHEGAVYSWASPQRGVADQ